MAISTRTEEADWILATYINAGYMDDNAGHPMGMRTLREALPGLTREEFDAALLDLILTAHETEVGIYVEPEPKLRSLTEEDREAAIYLGGEAKHLFSAQRLQYTE